MCSEVICWNFTSYLFVLLRDIFYHESINTINDMELIRWCSHIEWVYWGALTGRKPWRCFHCCLKYIFQSHAIPQPCFPLSWLLPVPPQFPYPLDPLPCLCFNWERNRPPRDNNQTQEICNKIRQKPKYGVWIGITVGGKESQVQAKESETHPLPLLGIPHKHQANSHNIYTED